MVVIGGSAPSGLSRDVVDRRLAMTGTGGPAALVKNIRVFGIAAFACIGNCLIPDEQDTNLTVIGGLLYGYNQGVFSGVLTMPNFGYHMGEYTQGRSFPDRSAPLLNERQTRRSKDGSLLFSSWAPGSALFAPASWQRSSHESMQSSWKLPFSSSASLSKLLPSLPPVLLLSSLVDSSPVSVSALFP